MTWLRGGSVLFVSLFFGLAAAAPPANMPHTPRNDALNQDPAPEEGPLWEVFGARLRARSPVGEYAAPHDDGPPPPADCISPFARCFLGAPFDLDCVR